MGIDAVASFSSTLINRQLVMLNVARQWVARRTVDREERGGRPTVRGTSREGGSKNTHTIDEEWEASLLHRVQAKGSKAAEQWGAARAAQVGKGTMSPKGPPGPHGVATLPTQGGQMAAADVATSLLLAPPSQRAPLEREPATTTPPRKLIEPHAVPAVGAAVFSCVGIGIAATCSSGLVSVACCCYPQLARPAFERPDHLTNPRGEDPPTPSLTRSEAAQR